MNIKDYLKDNVLLFDGAMGTYYAEKMGVAYSNCEYANIKNPDMVLKIHEEYISAGAKAIKTNTFGANKNNLNCKDEVLKNIIKSGYELANKASDNGKKAYVFGSIGPIVEGKGDVYNEYINIIDIFLDLGLNNFLFETFPSTEHLKEISKYIKDKNPNSFILVEFAITPEGFTRKGVSGKNIFNEFKDIKTIDAYGFNCISGPKHLKEFISKLDLSNKTISIMPNAGYPTVINNRTFFEGNPNYFAKEMLEIGKLGVSILGGCCGTNPKFISETSKLLKDFKKVVPKKKKVEIRIIEEKSHRLIDKIEDGKKIIAVELDPPLNTDLDFFMESAKRLKSMEVDAITIADCPIAKASVDSSLLASKLKKELDINTIPHMTCRDRNINASKALLLGLNIEGVENVLVVTGDPIPSAQRDEIKSVFSFNSVDFASYINELNKTIFMDNPFLICGALNINALNFDNQIRHAQRKIDNGVKILFTQPVFTDESIRNLEKAKNTLDVKIMGGIIPIVSHRNAMFMNNEISGINIPDNIINMYIDKEKEEAEEIAFNISKETANTIKDYVDGYYLMTPFKRIDLICKIADYIKSID